jgi:hypothetical protein
MKFTFSLWFDGNSEWIMVAGYIKSGTKRDHIYT